MGTELLLQLEDSGLATPTNYPTGRHSRYQIFTSTQNQWERIEFPLLDRPDPSTSDGAVDTIVLLFAPNTFTGDVYHYDNLDSYLAGGAPPPPPPPPASTMHVAAIVAGTQNAGQGNKRGAATVTIVDNNGQPVDGAGVTGAFTGDFNETVAGTTGGSGTVTLVTTGESAMRRTTLLCFFAVLATLGLMLSASATAAEQDDESSPASGAQTVPPDEPTIFEVPLLDEEQDMTPVPTAPPPAQPQAKSCAALPPQQTSNCTQCYNYCTQIPVCAPYCVPDESEATPGPYYCECVYETP